VTEAGDRVEQAPHDRPTVDELLQAVAEFVDGEASATTDGRRRFDLRVAANALAIVRRQLTVGAHQQAAHQARLARLGMRDDTELAAAIRSGALDDRYEEVLDVVRQSVRDKLMVANPGYADIGIDGPRERP
jgi:uncharacterized protein DUF6285